jgi:hypothetical protein
VVVGGASGVVVAGSDVAGSVVVAPGSVVVPAGSGVVAAGAGVVAVGSVVVAAGSGVVAAGSVAVGVGPVAIRVELVVAAQPEAAPAIAIAITAPRPARRAVRVAREFMAFLSPQAKLRIVLVARGRTPFIGGSTPVWMEALTHPDPGSTAWGCGPRGTGTSLSKPPAPPTS